MQFCEPRGIQQTSPLHWSAARRSTTGFAELTVCSRALPFVFLRAQVNDTVLLDIATNKITDVAKFDVGQLCMITGGRNTGRVGMVQHLEKHKGSFTIAHIKDAQGNVFSTRSDNVFVIGSGSKPLISLPKGARAAPFADPHASLVLVFRCQRAQRALLVPGCWVSSPPVWRSQRVEPTTGRLNLSLPSSLQARV